MSMSILVVVGAIVLGLIVVCLVILFSKSDK